MSIQSVSGVQTQSKKSTIARKVGALATTGFGLYAAGETMNTFKNTNFLSNAFDSYNSLNEKTKNLVSMENYVIKHIKVAKYTELGQAVAVTGIIASAAMGIGLIIDKCIDAYNKHKDAKQVPVQVIVVDKPSEE